MHVPLPPSLLVSPFICVHPFRFTTHQEATPTRVRASRSLPTGVISGRGCKPRMGQNETGRPNQTPTGRPLLEPGSGPPAAVLSSQRGGTGTGAAGPGGEGGDEPARTGALGTALFSRLTKLSSVVDIRGRTSTRARVSVTPP
jgi:hypothetical protein